MGVININGKTHIISGDNVSVTIVNGSVRVNGQTLESGLSGIVEIRWDGPTASIQSDASVTCGDVAGNVRAAGSVNAGNVTGSVHAGGSVRCNQVGGEVNAGGSVSFRR